jgi:hypothetical protein
MKNGKLISTIAALMAINIGTAMPARANDKNSNIGLKLSLGFGSQDVAKDRNLEKGEAAALSLGYGVSQRITLWLGADVSKHQQELDPSRENDLVGIQLGMQYKFRPHEKFRPYGKLGLGANFLGTEDEQETVLSGGGVNWALGAEYRLVRFLSVGAEIFWKDFDYTQQRIGGDKNDFTDLPDPLTGNTKGIMINFTLH